MTRLERQSFWETRVAEFKASRMSVTAWCAEHDVKSYQMWYWLRKERDTSPDKLVAYL